MNWKERENLHSSKCRVNCSTPNLDGDERVEKTNGSLKRREIRVPIRENPKLARFYP